MWTRLNNMGRHWESSRYKVGRRTEVRILLELGVHTASSEHTWSEMCEVKFKFRLQNGQLIRNRWPPCPCNHQCATLTSSSGRGWIFSCSAANTGLPALLSSFMKGKARTSLMEYLSAMNMTRRSIPIPNPAVGGSPYSRLMQKFSSTSWASSSPWSFCLACSSNRNRWSKGSFNSVYALTISFLQTNASNRSHIPAYLLLARFKNFRKDFRACLSSRLLPYRDDTSRGGSSFADDQ